MSSNVAVRRSILLARALLLVILVVGTIEHAITLHDFVVVELDLRCLDRLGYDHAGGPHVVPECHISYDKKVGQRSTRAFGYGHESPRLAKRDVARARPGSRIGGRAYDRGRRRLARSAP